MKIIDEKQLRDVIGFFNWAKEKIYRDHQEKPDVDVQPYAEERGINLEEYMELVKEVIGCDQTDDPTTHSYSVQYTILPIYEYRGNKLLVKHSDLKSISKGLLEYMKKERSDLV